MCHFSKRCSHGPRRSVSRSDRVRRAARLRRPLGAARRGRRRGRLPQLGPRLAARVRRQRVAGTLRELHRLRSVRVSLQADDRTV